MRTQELTIDEIKLQRKDFFKSKETSDSSGFNLTPVRTRVLWRDDKCQRQVSYKLTNKILLVLDVSRLFVSWLMKI